MQFRPTTDYEPRVPTETRTRAQQQHDALATALFVAASSELLPTIGGAAPTLVVSARADDVITGTGWASVEGCDEPVGIAAAGTPAAPGSCNGCCSTTPAGSPGSAPKNGSSTAGNAAPSRSATAAASSPAAASHAAWCEIHHVVEYANGGKTHTDNGVMLCWFHHRFLDLHGWEIRINRGVPEVRAPQWFDPTRQWRTVTKSTPRLHDLVDVQY